MSRSKLEEVLEVSDRKALLNTLIMGEVLTRRGQTGPLARIWAAREKKQGEPEDQEHRDSAGGTAGDR